jgi:hypothetical protein
MYARHSACPGICRPLQADSSIAHAPQHEIAQRERLLVAFVQQLMFTLFNGLLGPKDEYQRVAGR